ALLDGKRKGGAVVVPGRTADSLLVKRIDNPTLELRMPPPDKPQPSEADRKVLRDWIAAGAPAFATTTAATTPPPTPPPPATNHLPAQAEAILHKACFKCHGKDPAKIKAKLNILDYPALIKKKLIVPGDLANSEVLVRIEDNDRPMPPPPDVRLTDAERK